MDGNGRATADVRSDWTLDEVRALHALPFADLMHRAQSIHRRHFDPNAGPGLDAAVDQDRRLPRGLRLLPAEHPLRHRPRARGADGTGRRSSRARAPHARPARRASAWARPGASPKDRDLDKVVEMVERRRSARARDLRDARHADAGAGEAAQGRRASTTTTTTSTRRRSSTARSSRRAPTRTASTRSPPCATRASMSAAAASSAWANRPATASRFLHTLATLDPHPESVPINNLVQVAGTPLAGTPPSIRSNSCASSRSRAS